MKFGLGWRRWHHERRDSCERSQLETSVEATLVDSQSADVSDVLQVDPAASRKQMRLMLISNQQLNGDNSRPGGQGFFATTGGQIETHVFR